MYLQVATANEFDSTPETKHFSWLRDPMTAHAQYAHTHNMRVRATLNLAGLVRVSLHAAHASRFLEAAYRLTDR